MKNFLIFRYKSPEIATNRHKSISFLAPLDRFPQRDRFPATSPDFQRHPAINPPDRFPATSPDFQRHPPISSDIPRFPATSSDKSPRDRFPARSPRDRFPATSLDFQRHPAINPPDRFTPRFPIAIDFQRHPPISSDIPRFPATSSDKSPRSIHPSIPLPLDPPSPLDFIRFPPPSLDFIRERFPILRFFNLFFNIFQRLIPTFAPEG